MSYDLINASLNARRERAEYLNRIFTNRFQRFRRGSKAGAKHG